MDEISCCNTSCFAVKRAPRSVFYIPDFISREEETDLLFEIYRTPKPKWEQLSHRRLQNWGGIVGKNCLIPDQMPTWLLSQIDKIDQLKVFPDGCKPNHVLLNEYTSGQGIMPHFDGPVYHPIVSTISLGSHTFLDFYEQIASPESAVSNSVDHRDPSSNAMTNAVDETVHGEDMSKNGSGVIDKNCCGRDGVLMDNISCSSSKVGKQKTDLITKNHELTGQRCYAGSLLLQPRSLVIIRDKLYTDYLHGIAERKVDRIRTGEGVGCSSGDEDYLISDKIWNFDEDLGLDGGFLPRDTRVSLTIRYVPKVAKVSVNSLIRR